LEAVNKDALSNVTLNNGANVHLKNVLLSDVATTQVAGIATCCLNRANLARLTGKLVLNYQRHAASKPLPVLVFSLNGQAISLAGSDPGFRAAMQSADLVHADGQSVVTLSGWFSSNPVAQRSATTDMVHDIPRYVPATMRHFFLGGTQEIVAQAAQIYQRTHANVVVCGYHDGYFEAAEEPAVISKINAAKPDILWVGLGKPKEQMFCVRHKDKLQLPVVISCGGCFNFLTGHYRRAPQWMQRSGLEWLHRMASSPGKLFWRYAVTNPHAIYLACKYRDKSGADHGNSAIARHNKKVLFLLKTFSMGGGVERVSANLAESLSRFGYQPEFWVFFSTELQVKELSKRWPVRLISTEQTGLPAFIKALLTLRRYVRDERINVVISAKETANLISACAFSFMSDTLKIFVRHVAFDVTDQKLNPFTIKLLYCLYALTNCRIVAVSETLATQIKRFLPYRQRRVCARANPIISDDIFQLAELPSNLGSGYLCAVGRLCEQKGFDLLLKAYALAMQRKPDLPMLVIVGEGEDRALLIQLAEQLGISARVIFYGFTTNPYRIMKRARLFILPSRHEGLPTVLVEAIALGVPVVASDCQTGPRELLDEGRYGGLVPVNNVQALADGIIVHLENPLITAPQVIDKYRFSNAASGYMQLFGER
jgi:N-acetylglucosaminyldiphosphoundecaprenol N-acetyl-beta-D-mannosaminyltransferase